MKTIKNKTLSIFILASLLILVFSFPTTALAQGINVGNTVNQGEVLDQNVVLYGPTVTMNGTINGDLFAIGTDIKINGQVNGDLAVIGKNVYLNGPVSGSVYISALFLIVGPQASVGNDVYFIGNSINTQNGSTIKRDLNAIGLESELTGNVNRKVNALIGPVTLAQKVYEFLQSKGWWPKSLQIKPRSFQYAPGENPTLGLAFGLSPLRNLALPSSHYPIRVSLDTATGAKAAQQSNAIDTTRVRTWATQLLRTLVSLLILGLLIVWLAPTQLGLAKEQARLKPWRALLTGLLVFVLGWLVALLAVVIFLALAFFFYWISLPVLGFFTGTFGLITVGLFLSLFWLSIAYISKIIIAFLIGSLIVKRLLPSYTQSRVLPLVFGVIIYALLASIPYLGWLIAVLASLIGLGALWMLTNPQKQADVQTVEQIQPVESHQEMSTTSEG